MSHPDYEKNFSDATKWIAHQHGKLPSSMSIRIGDSDNLKKSLLCFSCHSQGNTFSHPISLHQNNEVFRKEIKRIHAIYFKLATFDIREEKTG